MALIKCDECGQMVSDRAEACPHCGCPVNQNPQPKYDRDEDDDGKKSNNSLRWLLGALAALVVLGGAALYAWQSGMFNKAVALEDTVAVDSTPTMAAPVIELDGDGLFSIKDCPTTYEGLEIEPNIASNGTLTSVVVKINGDQTQTQTLNVNSAYFGNVTNIVHFLDANFDDYVDFMVGTGECEQSSALFLWSPDESKFVQALSDGSLSFTGGSSYSFRFHPQSQKIYHGGYGDMDIQYLMSWVGNDLRAEEEFIQSFSPSMYYDKINHRYTILDSKTQKVIFSNDDPSKLPDRWKKMARVLTPEEEAEFANNEADFLDEETPDYDDIEEVKSWIQGNWRYRMVTEFGPMEMRIGISGDYLVEMINGEMYYSGEYTIDGDCLRFNSGNGASDVIYIDRDRRRLMATRSDPMTRF